MKKLNTIKDILFLSMSMAMVGLVFTSSHIILTVYVLAGYGAISYVLEAVHSYLEYRQLNKELDELENSLKE